MTDLGRWNHQLDGIVKFYDRRVTCLSLIDEGLWIQIQVGANHLACTGNNVSLLLYLDQRNNEILLWVGELKLLKSYILEIQTERFKHDFCQVQPSIINLYFIGLFFYLTISDAKLILITFDCLCHVSNSLFFNTVGLTILLIFEQVKHSLLPLLLFLLPFEFPSEHLYNLCVLILRLFRCLLIKLLH